MGWDEGHMLRRIFDVPVPGKRPEKYRKTGGKTRVKEIYVKCKVKGGRTGQDKVEE